MISKKNILVTGANGQLGNECKVLSAQYKESNFVFTDVEELSIIDDKAVEEIFSKNNFDYCIDDYEGMVISSNLNTLISESLLFQISECDPMNSEGI